MCLDLGLLSLNYHYFMWTIAVAFFKLTQWRPKDTNVFKAAKLSFVFQGEVLCGCYPQVRSLRESRLKARWWGGHRAKSRSNEGCAAQLELSTAGQQTLAPIGRRSSGAERADGCVAYIRRAGENNIWTHCPCERVCACVTARGCGRSECFQTHDVCISNGALNALTPPLHLNKFKSSIIKSSIDWVALQSQHATIGHTGRWWEMIDSSPRRSHLFLLRSCFLSESVLIFP